MRIARLALLALVAVTLTAHADDGAPRKGPDDYVCDGLAGELTVIYLETNAELLSIHWGSHAALLQRTRAASGALFTAPDTDEREWILWIKGGEATFVRPGEPAVTCHIVEDG